MEGGHLLKVSIRINRYTIGQYIAADATIWTPIKTVNSSIPSGSVESQWVTNHEPKIVETPAISSNINNSKIGKKTVIPTPNLERYENNKIEAPNKLVDSTAQAIPATPNNRVSTIANIQKPTKLMKEERMISFVWFITLAKLAYSITVKKVIAVKNLNGIALSSYSAEYKSFMIGTACQMQNAAIG